MSASLPTTDPWWGRPFQDSWTLGALLDHAGQRHGHRQALWSEDHGSLTHAEIRSRAARVRAALLAAAGPGGRTVACLTCMDAPWYVGLQAVLTSGLAYAALEPEAPTARNLMCLEDCGAEVILTDVGSMEKARGLAEGKRRVVLIDDAMAHHDEAPLGRLTPDAPAAYVFTSGSTGRPKAVVRSQRSMARAMYCFAENLGYTPEDVMLYPGSPGHIGSLNDALTCMTTGFCSMPMDIAKMDLRKVCNALVEHRVTRMPMPPSLLRLLLRLMADARGELHLKTVVASGEALLRSDVGLFYEVLTDRAVLWQNYGSTETGPMAAGRYTAADAQGEGPLPLRRTHIGNTLDVIDGSGKVLPPGETGEVRVRSAYLADGYLNAPPDQAARFGKDDRGRYFMIGDRAYRSESGELFIAGRGDRQIKLHGRRLDLGDVESAIMDHREWVEAVVVHTNGHVGPPSLVAVVRPAPGTQTDILRLRTDLASRLPPAAIPRRFLVVQAMPRTTTGKIDLAAVSKLAAGAAQVAAIGRGGPPQGLMENWIADTWQFILRIERPGREDRFQDLGGDSLAAIDLSLALEKHYGVSVPMDRIAECQTIARLADELQHGTATRREGLVRLRSDGAGPLCVMFPGVGGHAWVFAELARVLNGPCDMLGVSLVDMLERSGESLRLIVREQVLNAVHGASGRPVVIGGYSFGGMIAADTASWLVSKGIAVDHVLLVDPSPVNSAPPRKTLPSIVRSARALLPVGGGRERAARRTAAEERIEEAVERVTSEVRRTYMDGSVRLPNVEVSWVASAVMAAKHAKATKVFGRDTGSIRRHELSCGHLELLRAPKVAETAAWVDAQIGVLSRR